MIGPMLGLTVFRAVTNLSALGAKLEFLDGGNFFTKSMGRNCFESLSFHAEFAHLHVAAIAQGGIFFRVCVQTFGNVFLGVAALLLVVREVEDIVKDCFLKLKPLQYLPKILVNVMIN